MSLIQIKSWLSAKILFELEAPSLRVCIEAAVSQRANLKGANLKGANLEGANLKGANLKGADLEGADLEGADLEGADLEGANLEGANLEGANLEGANLKGANLKGADLEGADLEGADLEGADLEGAYLKGADLTPIRDDFWSILAGAPKEIPGLRAALLAGKIDGSTYTGQCACLVGTIANVRGCDYMALGAVKPNGGRPAERFFLGIRPGDTPENSQHARIVLGWIDEFTANMRAAFAVTA